MNHNPHNLKVGDAVILDVANHTNFEVVIINMTERKVYSRVQPKGKLYSWEVMTNRLTPLKSKYNLK